MGCSTNESGTMTFSLHPQRDEECKDRGDYDCESGLRLRNGSCRKLRARNRNLIPNPNLHPLVTVPFPQFAAAKSLAV